MISEGVQTNGGLSNGYPSPPQPAMMMLHQQHQGSCHLFNDVVKYIYAHPYYQAFVNVSCLVSWT